jgi:hypothetical protein
MKRAETRQEAIAKLIDQANGLDLLAEECEAIAKHFRPRFEECWAPPLRDGEISGQLRNSDMALRLRPFVIDREADALRMRSEAQDLRDAATLLEHSN